MTDDPFIEKMKSGKKTNPIWPEQPGDLLVGTFKEVREIKVGDELRKLYTIMEEGLGIDYSVWGCKVINSEFESQQIKSGERVGIRYDGMVKKYHSYYVSVDRDNKNVEPPF